MSTTTPNLGLTKPGQLENFDIDIQNNNMDTIDSKVVPRGFAQIHGTATGTGYEVALNSTSSYFAPFWTNRKSTGGHPNTINTNTTLFDTTSLLTGSEASSYNWMIGIKKSGYYEISFQAYFYACASGNVLWVMPYVNTIASMGNQQGERMGLTFVRAGGASEYVNNTKIVYLNAGEQIGLAVKNGSNNADKCQMYASTFLQIKPV